MRFLSESREAQSLTGKRVPHVPGLKRRHPFGRRGRYSCVGRSVERAPADIATIGALGPIDLI